MAQSVAFPSNDLVDSMDERRRGRSNEYLLPCSIHALTVPHLLVLLLVLIDGSLGEGGGGGGGSDAVAAAATPASSFSRRVGERAATNTIAVEYFYAPKTSTAWTETLKGIVCRRRRRFCAWPQSGFRSSAGTTTTTTSTCAALVLASGSRGRRKSELPPISSRMKIHRTPLYSSSSSSSSLDLDLPPSLYDIGSGVLGSAAAPLLALIALILLIAAQSFINRMLEGDRGLGAFLSDGTGYGRSGFKPRRSTKSFSSSSSSRSTGASNADAPLGGPDPLPWLKLPELDFVEVAGQSRPAADRGGWGDGTGNDPLSPEEEGRILERLEDMASTLRAELKAGNIREAEAIKIKLEREMEKYGIEYEEGFQ